MNKKNVLYIGGFELPDKNAAAQRVISNAKILRLLGYNVTLLGFDRNISFNSNSIEKKTYEGFVYFNLPYPRRKTEWVSYLFGIKHIKELVKKEEISCIFAYNYPGIALFRLLKICKKNKVKLVSDCTEWYEAKGNIFFKFIKSIDVYVRMKIVHPKINGIIVISNFLYEFYKKYNISILNIPPLVDLTMDKWQPIENDNHNDNHNDNIHLIYAGSPGGGNKDRLDDIISTITRVGEVIDKKILLTIVGVTRSEYVNLFNVHENDFKGSFVYFKGRLSHVETLNEIKKADFQIFFRNKNLTNTAGFPTKYVEAISCGTPVLTNATSNIVDYFISGQTGYLLDFSNDELLVKELVNILSISRKKIINMKKYCFDAKIFDINNYISVFDKFMKEL